MMKRGKLTQVPHKQVSLLEPKALTRRMRMKRTRSLMRRIASSTSYAASTCTPALPTKAITGLSLTHQLRKKRWMEKMKKGNGALQRKTDGWSSTTRL